MKCGSPSIDVPAVNERLLEYMESLGCVLQKKGEAYETRCPVHEERSASFRIDQRQGVLLCKCFGCGFGGDLIDLHCALTGRDPRTHFREALLELAERFNITSSGDYQYTPRPRPAVSPEPQEDPKTAAMVEVARQQLPAILERYSRPNWREHLWESSPERLIGDPADDWKLILRFFPPGQPIWMGDVTDTGQPRHARHFKTREDWLKSATMPGPRIAGCTFQEGSYSRSDANVKQRLFLVLEGDAVYGKPQTDEEKEANKGACFALIRWAADVLKLTLLAVVDSANKSLHGWLRLPSQRTLEGPKVIADAMKLDVNLIKSASSPLRLPGCIHDSTDQPASLLYLDTRYFVNP